MYHLKALGLGFLGLFLGSCLVVGPQQTGFALFLLVACTGGLGLIPLLLGSYLIGLLVLAVASASAGAQPALAPPPGLSPTERAAALARYAHRARVQGHSDAEIAAVAENAGWSRTEVQEALAHVPS